MIDKPKEGWTFLINSTKWHYFRDNYSLCRKFLLLKMPSDLEQNDNFGSPDNCKVCEKKRKAEIERAKKEDNI